MNVEKMRQIGADILAEPRRFNMGTWGASLTAEDIAGGFEHAEGAIPPCGTVCCFAGWWALRYAGVSTDDLAAQGIMVRATVRSSDGFLDDMAKADLGLPNYSLFCEESWPAYLRTDTMPGTREYAEHFVYRVLESYISADGWSNEQRAELHAQMTQTLANREIDKHWQKVHQSGWQEFKPSRRLRRLDPELSNEDPAFYEVRPVPLEPFPPQFFEVPKRSAKKSRR